VAEIALIQGSISPWVGLPKGALAVVPYTRRIQRMADRGVIIIVARRPIALTGGGDG
jgi:hypothetical protein